MKAVQVSTIQTELVTNILTAVRGHSYEVGLWVSQWSAAALLSAMLHILIEELRIASLWGEFEQHIKTGARIVSLQQLQQ